MRAMILERTGAPLCAVELPVPEPGAFAVCALTCLGRRRRTRHAVMLP